MFGTLKSGEVITPESEIVKQFMLENPDFGAELAIATLITKDSQTE